MKFTYKMKYDEILNRVHEQLSSLEAMRGRILEGYAQEESARRKFWKVLGNPDIEHCRELMKDSKNWPAIKGLRVAKIEWEISQLEKIFSAACYVGGVTIWSDGMLTIDQDMHEMIFR